MLTIRADSSACHAVRCDTLQAQFCPDAFARVHLEGTLDHLVQACSKLDQRGAAFLALGQVSQLYVDTHATNVYCCSTFSSDVK
jgi:hypothetical protein